MKDVSFFSKIYLATKPVDFRKQIAGLSAIVGSQFDLDCFENRSIFIFTNRKKSSIKMLYWDSTGFAIWMKKLEESKFKWPKATKGIRISLSARELKWLLQGIDISSLTPHEPVKFEKTF